MRSILLGLPSYNNRFSFHFGGGAAFALPNKARLISIDTSQGDNGPVLVLHALFFSSWIARNSPLQASAVNSAAIAASLQTTDRPNPPLAPAPPSFRATVPPSCETIHTKACCALEARINILRCCWSPCYTAPTGGAFCMNYRARGSSPLYGSGKKRFREKVYSHGIASAVYKS